jgi:hypothetical protein
MIGPLAGSSPDNSHLGGFESRRLVILYANFYSSKNTIDFSKFFGLFGVAEMVDALL